MSDAKADKQKPTTTVAPKPRKPRTAKPKTSEQIIMKHVRTIAALGAKLRAAQADVPEDLRARVQAVAAALAS